MYAVIRPALRSTSTARSPARFIRGRRYPQPHRVQPFHSTRCLANTPDPTSTPENTPAVNSKDVDRKNGEKAEAGEHGQVDSSAAAATEDPELLAQKLQRSKEMTRRYSSALRRQQRRNRAQDLPPLSVPEWYLEKRVILSEDAPAPPVGASKRHDYALALKHTASGEHAALAIPVPTYAAAFKAVQQLIKALWRRGMDEEHMKLLARDFARRVGREDDAEFVKALENGEEPRIGLWEEMENIALDAAKQEKEPAKAEAKAAKMRDRLLHERRHISPLLLAEIRATMAASLSAVQPDINHSFPAAKTNIILHSPSNKHEADLNRTVQSLASELGADVVTLQAQDLAQLAGDYLGDGPGSSPNSIRSLGYDTYKFGPDFSDEVVMWGDKEGAGEEQDPSMDQQPMGGEQPGNRPPHLKVYLDLRKLGLPSGMQPGFRGAQTASNPFAPADNGASNIQSGRGQSQSDINLEDLKLSTLLEALVDATDLKRNRTSRVPQSEAKSGSPASAPSDANTTSKEPKLFDYLFKTDGEELDFTSALPVDPTAGLAFTVHHQSSSGRPQIPQRSKIIHVRDIKELNGTQYGSRILQKLEEIVRARRNAGESIMILGTTCSEDLTPEMSPSGVQGLQAEGGEGLFRTIVVTPGSVEEDLKQELRSTAMFQTIEMGLSRGEKRKFRNINLRHIQDMLRCLDPVAAANIADMHRGVEGYRNFSSTFPDSYFWSVLAYDEVHRIALTALGLRQMDPTAAQVSWAHVTLAMGLLKASDEIKFAWTKSRATEQERTLKDQFREHVGRLQAAMGGEPLSKRRDSFKSDAAATKRQMDLNRIKETANAHEKKLMNGIVNPDQIKTTFESIHVPQETVEAVRTLTSLSLLRPDAFNYGVLATEKISGALLYGPPGTGKTLLAKAVAKESGCAVLEVSGSQIMDKYVGEGEKNVAAIFSLARKLSPCIVFLDEADAIFGTRDRSSERTSHRDILNQFLKEWDGLNNLSVFVMVATNRPFDMDDAVIRRLPRRLLVDLPLQEDRRKILEIHLKGEQLDAGVDLDDLAKRTPLYSGSDLKNVAVFAALACVREENEQAAMAAAKAVAAKESLKAATETIPSASEADASETPSSEDTTTSSSPASSTPTTTPSGFPLPPPLDTPFPSTSTPSTSSSSTTPKTPTPIPTLVMGQTYTFPERRTLHNRHFDKALQEVSASISENMSSLTAIKKFDEQYGDRKGRKKKTKYGFGPGGGEGESEREARVRP